MGNKKMNRNQKAIKKKKYSTWKCSDGNLTTVEGTEPPKYANGTLMAERNDLVEIFEAESLEKAFARHDKIYDQLEEGNRD